MSWTDRGQCTWSVRWRVCPVSHEWPFRRSPLIVDDGLRGQLQQYTYYMCGRVCVLFSSLTVVMSASLYQTDWIKYRASHTFLGRSNTMAVLEKIFGGRGPSSFGRQQRLSEITIHRVPEKTSHFNFRHNFAICWYIFTIFESPCSGLIAGWCNLLHTHHRCEAFTWCDVTHAVIQAVACSAHWHWISYHLTYGVWTPIHPWNQSKIWGAWARFGGLCPLAPA